MSPDIEILVASLRDAVVRESKFGGYATFRIDGIKQVLDALEAAEGAAEKLRGLNDMQAKELEAAEQRAETLRVALEECKEACEQSALDKDFSCWACGGCFNAHAQRCPLSNTIIRAERALKGEG